MISRDPKQYLITVKLFIGSHCIVTPKRVFGIIVNIILKKIHLLSLLIVMEVRDHTGAHSSLSERCGESYHCTLDLVFMAKYCGINQE